MVFPASRLFSHPVPHLSLDLALRLEFRPSAFLVGLTKLPGPCGVLLQMACQHHRVECIQNPASRAKGIPLAPQTPESKLMVQLWPLFLMHCNELKCSEVAQSCPTLCDPMNCSLPGLTRDHNRYFFIYNFIYLYLTVLGLHCCSGFSLVVESGGYSLAVAHWLLIAVDSFVAEHRSQSIWASVVVAHRLSCPAACGIFLNKGSNLCPLAGGVLTTEPLGKPTI